MAWSCSRRTWRCSRSEAAGRTVWARPCDASRLCEGGAKARAATGSTSVSTLAPRQAGVGGDVGVSSGPAIDGRRVVADLRELERRTGGPAGAQRVCWTETWRQAQAFLAELLEEIGVVPERDAAGNVWALLTGDEE